MIPTSLSPIAGIVLLLVMLFCGRAFRENWKAQAEGWQKKAWLYGCLAFLAFLPIAFLPLDV